MSSADDEASATDVTRTITTLATSEAVASCAQARDLALRIDRILADAARITGEHGALRLAHALAGTLLDELARLQRSRAAR